MKRIILSALAALFIAGCATTPKIDWTARVGNYTYDQAVTELGPPDKSAKMTDGTVVAEWLTEHGYVYATTQPYPFYTRGYVGVFPQTYSQTRMPDYFLRLTFGPDGRLTAWKKFAR